MFVQICFIGHLATLRPTLDRRQGGTLSHPMLMTTIFQARGKVTGSLVMRLVPKA